MKHLLFLSGWLFMTTALMAKSEDIYGPNYGINVYQSSTASGYGASLNINLNVQQFNKVFELGVMFDDRNQRFKGLEFVYKHFIGFRSGNFYKKTVKPFVYYDFLYRTPTEVIQTNGSTANNFVMSGKMTTLEHALGMGVQVKLLSQFYCEGDLGFGVYLGSHYQGSTPKTWGFHKNNYGYVPSFKFGIGYQF